MPTSSKLIACLVTVAAIAAPAASAAGPAASSLSPGKVVVRAPKCSRAAKTRVTVIGKPGRTGVVRIVLAKMVWLASVLTETDSFKENIVSSTFFPPGGVGPVTIGEPQSVNSIAPVGIPLTAIVVFAPPSVSDPLKTVVKSFRIAKCPKKSHFTG